MDEQRSEPFFRRHAGELRLTWPETTDEPAFRAAQLGALLALAGHLQTSREPAQAVLPTGVGKTAVICGLPFLVPNKRVLVVVPTRLLRDQIHDELVELGILRRLGAVDFDDNPRVARVDHRLVSSADWEALEEVDVAVGTPAVLSAEYADIADPPRGLFDLLVFDEAHHLPATTWTGLLRQHDQPAALLTATPFRRDRKALPGTLTYNYSLRQAIADDVYSPIVFVPVDADEDDDAAIAGVARMRLEDPTHQREDSLLLVRSDRIDHAHALADAYEAAGVAIDVITSRHSARHVRAVLKRLREGELQGVACVGALVEGFDMPRMKIAAYHRPHRTLAPTLQFVGRIARVTGGEAHAELVAARTSFSRETRELYREDTAWTRLLPELVDAAIERERVRRVYVSEADVTPADISP
ncbi:MAG TPA: DEAD/DEAH box helicase family protein, partial [Gaiellaceae bacterium]|nr:DEAD/DEAH box helicase family protein [Gaiellaceae bacterium]